LISISPEDLSAIREHGERDYPYECCGLLIGRFDADGVKVAIETYPISNAREESAKRNRFLIEPEELMRGERHAASKKLDVVGFYHSHPDHPARPSQYDLDHAWPTFAYVIVAVAAGKASDMTVWWLKDDRTQFEKGDLHGDENTDSNTAPALHR
jgi:proteasome lid subunit RPN8/RPN11